MQIRYRGGDKFEIKSGEIKIQLEEGVMVDGFAFPGPGEYEKAGVSVQGIADGDNTIYVLRIEEIGLCYLGLLSHNLSEDVLKEIGNVDILFLPLGEKGTLSMQKATDLATSIDSRIVIPMLYGDLTEFKKSEGVSGGETDLLKIKRSDLPEEERQIVILKPNA